MKTGKVKRCGWAEGAPLIEYHDSEYGNIKSTDSALFEQLCLAIFAAGRINRSLMEKRNDLLTVFFNYDTGCCSRLREPSIKKISRERGLSLAKVQALKNNAACCINIIEEHGSLFKFFYAFKQPERLLTALKRYGFSQVGQATVSCFMKNIGAIEAHDSDCFMFTSSVEG